jgi:hypothetical protein
VGAKGRPEEMREAMADYVAATHHAYRDHAELLPPGVRGRLALMRLPHFWVAAAGAANLHVIATAEALGPARGQEVDVDGEAPPLSWTLRFYDPVVTPALGLLDESSGPALEEVRRILGISTYLYHLVVQPGSELTSHHAGHAGSGLANAHAAEARDFESMRSAAPHVVGLVDEMEGAARAGLRRAQVLLAREILEASGRSLELAAESDPTTLRQTLLEALLASRASR